EEREKAGMSVFPEPDIVAGRIDAIVGFDRTAELGTIKTPTLVTCAKDDFLTPPYFTRELARLIPGAELLLLERGGHCASETNLREFNDAVLTFIARHSQRAAFQCSGNPLLPGSHSEAPMPSW